MDEKLYLPHSTRCFICGESNDVGLKCRFFTNETGHVYLTPTVQPHYCGFMSVVHGGIQTAMLDEAMGWCGFTQGESEELYFTREINVKFKRNVPPSVPIFIETSLTDIKRGFAYTEGSIRDESGTVMTTATGIFVPIPKVKMAETSNFLLYVNDGRRYLEKAMRVCNPTAV
ncbi:MAG: PaaI family thioesterase [Deferribacteraceae bacterium]|nr:PaaI family thioesterase [Deferribacteraceae bacterium]